ncbi:peptidoglycan DD-metalloendopeptidase family protein [Desulfovibrio sp. OttesenSCG-928-C14]|nr:peptidoglycan DD-metalloendopeptidase family protein [Desulfovibrio sp. OttesenSCG-928-C14]
MRNGLKILFLLFFCCLALAAGVWPAGAATSERQLLDNIKREEERAKARRENISRLTQQERALDRSLAQAEDRILALEKSLDQERARLRELARSGESAQVEYAILLREKEKSEQAMREVLRALWDIYSRRQSVRARDFEEWTQSEREYSWTSSLFESLEQYRREITEQEAKIAEVNRRRSGISSEINTRMDKIEDEMASLLRERIRYEQQLATTRKQKVDTESELNQAMDLIRQLNFNLSNVRLESQDIGKSKGRLLWPAAGRVAVKYNARAKPPVRGVSFATDLGAPIRAVHQGKVMYNDTMRGLGHVVVLQHGDAYFSVYAFLLDSPLKPGQSIGRGDNIGRAGYYPALKSNGLYFELRHHQNTVDPESWFGPRS